jgi:hypothetical protein
VLWFILKPDNFTDKERDAESQQIASGSTFLGWSKCNHNKSWLAETTDKAERAQDKPCALDFVRFLSAFIAIDTHRDRSRTNDSEIKPLPATAKPLMYLTAAQRLGGAGENRTHA